MAENKSSQEKRGLKGLDISSLNCVVQEAWLTLG